MRNILKCTLLVMIIGCKQATSEEILNKNKNLNVSLIVDYVNSNGNVLKLNGKDPISGTNITFQDVNSWYFYFGEKIEIGDTIIKKRGEAIFLIKKEKENLKIDYYISKNNFGEKSGKTSVIKYDKKGNVIQI